MIATGDFNLDGFQDIVALPTKTVRTIAGDSVDSNICFFIGSESGLDVTNWNSSDFIDNSSSIDPEPDIQELADTKALLSSAYSRSEDFMLASERALSSESPKTHR